MKDLVLAAVAKVMEEEVAVRAVVEEAEGVIGGQTSTPGRGQRNGNRRR